ncbi:Hypothetical predicted protein [Mytilus galloprovincialis]|uniref:Reverse transcriptase domain-containing protein n=1 Tax=Mytilus galloprovincialis TaxID=29158 RepID=A0A8B6GJ38_MYTGA|nr:Hypothetical predicted protein [Mytilus galloprovincialis]
MESKLKAVRRGHRGQVTKLFKKFDEIENNSDLDKDDVKLISDAIEQKQRTIVDLNEKILDLTSEEDVAEEIQESDEYMFNLESKLRKIRKITHSDSISQNVASTSLDPNANSFTPSYPTNSSLTNANVIRSNETEINVQPTNFDNFRSMQNTHRDLQSTNNLKYSEIIEDQMKRGFIEKVNDKNDNGKSTHYIPHHAVKKDSTTTPIRIVYDCSCKKSPDHASLNDCLMSTPPDLNDLTKILMGFRTKKYAISTDIEKAFLHIGLDEKDRDFTRFFWLSDTDNPSSTLTTYRFKSILFGATSSPFILNATLLKHLDACNTNVSAMMKNDLYVDNILSSLENEDDAAKYFVQARSLMSDAGFNLRSWSSNCSKLTDLAKQHDYVGPLITVITEGAKPLTIITVYGVKEKLLINSIGEPTLNLLIRESVSRLVPGEQIVLAVSLERVLMNLPVNVYAMLTLVDDIVKTVSIELICIGQ